LRFRFDPLGTHFEVQAFRHADDRGCDRAIIRIHGNIPNKLRRNKASWEAVSLN